MACWNPLYGKNKVAFLRGSHLKIPRTREAGWGGEHLDKVAMIRVSGKAADSTCGGTWTIREPGGEVGPLIFEGRRILETNGTTMLTRNWMIFPTSQVRTCHLPPAEHPKPTASLGSLQFRSWGASATGGAGGPVWASGPHCEWTSAGRHMPPSSSLESPQTRTRKRTDCSFLSIMSRPSYA